MKKNQPERNGQMLEERKFLYPAKHAYSKRFSWLVWMWPLASAAMFLLSPWRQGILDKVLKKFPGSAEIGSWRLGFTRMHVTLMEVKLSNCIIPGGWKLDGWAGTVRIRFDARALRRGLLACSVTADRLNFKLLQSKAETGNHVTAQANKEWPPVVLDELQVTNSTFHYAGTTSQHPVQGYVENIVMHAQDLSTLPSTVPLPAKIHLRAGLYEGWLNLHLRARLVPQPAFDMNARLEDMNLVRLNDFFRAYGKFDLSSGIASIYTEVAGKDGHYKGYIKPLLRNVEVVGPEDRGDSFLRRIWEALVGAAASLLKNRHQDQLGTRISFEGNYDMHVHVFRAVMEVLLNAFFRSLKPTLEHDIDLSSVESK